MFWAENKKDVCITGPQLLNNYLKEIMEQTTSGMVINVDFEHC